MFTIVSDVHSYYFAGSVISMFCLICVIGSYWGLPELRKHPAGVVVIRCLFDLLFAVQFIMVYAYADSVGDHCNALSIVFQVSTFASLSYYFVMAVDLVVSLSNPFVASQTHIWKYHGFVLIFTVLTALVVALSKQTGYREGFEFCWIKISSEASSANPYNWSLFFGPLIAYLFLSIGGLVWANKRLSVGLEATFQVRGKVVRNLRHYVISFAVYWIIAAALYIPCLVADVNITRATSDAAKSEIYDQYSAVYKVFALVLGLRGLPDAIVWSFNQRLNRALKRWWKGEPVPETLPDINFALRKEVLIYTTRGISSSIEQALKSEFPSYPLESKFYPQFLYPSDKGDCSIVKVAVIRNETLFDTNRPSLSNLTPAPINSSDVKSPVILHEEILNLNLDIAGDSSKIVPFLDFAPQVFRYLRFIFGIDDASYKNSLRGNTEAMCERYTEGRSSSWFYFSEDNKYIVKTLERTEIELLLTLLPDYLSHMKRNRDSLLVKFVGLHAITMYGDTKYFAVMRSVFITDKKIHERYDIKGSTVDRHSKPGESVLKDSDFHRKLLLSQDARDRLLRQCEADSTFLMSHGIMDYSILLGIHHSRQTSNIAAYENISRRSSVEINTGFEMNRVELPTIPTITTAASRKAKEVPSFFTQHEGGLGAQVIEGPGLYFMGIIDILQAYNTDKKMEKFAKTWILRKDPNGISCVPPVPYALRFLKKIDEIIQVCENETDLFRVEVEKEAKKLKSIMEASEDPDDNTV